MLEHREKSTLGTAVSRIGNQIHEALLSARGPENQ